MSPLFKICLTSTHLLETPPSAMYLSVSSRPSCLPLSVCLALLSPVNPRVKPCNYRLPQLLPYLIVCFPFLPPGYKKNPLPHWLRFKIMPPNHVLPSTPSIPCNQTRACGVCVMYACVPLTTYCCKNKIKLIKSLHFLSWLVAQLERKN